MRPPTLLRVIGSAPMAEGHDWEHGNATVSARASQRQRGRRVGPRPARPVDASTTVILGAVGHLPEDACKRVLLTVQLPLTQLLLCERAVRHDL